jgi:hypothetical protein
MTTKTKTKEIIGWALIAIGVLVGLYVGIWVCFIGGIVGFIHAVRAETLVPMCIALNIARIMFAGVIGGLSFLCFFFPGGKLIN